MYRSIKIRWFVTVLLIITLGGSLPASACLWDSDTLAMERRQFPSSLELISGKFLRHSNEFYRWRVINRMRQITASPAPELYDDLAVAYEKLGEHEKAIKTMFEKEQAYPGLYETRANLGTFYIHSGELKKGLAEIDKALEINPNAHFGREEYQKLLVEYLISKQVDGQTTLPLSDGPAGFQSLKSKQNFTTFLLESQNVNSENQKAEIANAIEGVLGMMRFGDYDSPILLEALGDLLSSNSGTENGLRLAARAFLKASYAADDAEVSSAYRKKAKEVLKMQLDKKGDDDPMPLAMLEAKFSKELNEAELWFEQIETDESDWIAKGMNPEKQFGVKYYEEPSISGSNAYTKHRRMRIYIATTIAVVMTIAVVAIWINNTRKGL